MVELKNVMDRKIVSLSWIGIVSIELAVAGRSSFT